MLAESVPEMVSVAEPRAKVAVAPAKLVEAVGAGLAMAVGVPEEGGAIPTPEADRVPMLSE
jgi:hypothetical protein